MEVTLKIATSKEQSMVYISGSINIRSMAGMDQHINAMKVAREWLKKELARKAPVVQE